MPTAPNKTVQTDLLAWQDVASGAQAISSAFDCSGKYAASCGIFIGRQTGTAFTAGSPNVRIEARVASSDQWVPIYTYQPQVGSSIANTTQSSSVSAGATSFAVASATNIAAGDLLYLKDTTASNYELVRVKSIVSTTITPEEAVLKNHNSGGQVTDQAECVFPAFDVTPYTAVRAVVDNVGSGQGIAARVTLTTWDSVG